MDIKDRRHRSLTRGRCGKECRYTSSSLDSEDCRVPTQKSYSSSETLKAYDHDTRMHYGNRVSDLVHRESDEFPRQVKLNAFDLLQSIWFHHAILKSETILGLL
ncbi:Teneurin-2 [Willisornis vidua]|uniref:Teneurin-2 n=1 Tax=Willisornis vidua TaxID=1566151 RepID=A0ABQ9CV39_9PASS|nr:Teneurin-2 [Willisornis vidua]